MELDFSFFAYSPRPKEKKPRTPACIAFKASSKLALPKKKDSKPADHSTSAIVQENDPISTMTEDIHKPTLFSEKPIELDTATEAYQQMRSNSIHTIVLSDSSDDYVENSASSGNLSAARLKKPVAVIVYSSSETSGSQNSFQVNQGLALQRIQTFVLATSSEIAEEESIACDATIDKQTNFPLLSLEKERDIKKWLSNKCISDDDIDSDCESNKKKADRIVSPNVKCKDPVEKYDPLPNAVNTLMDELYGTIWRSAKKTTVPSSSGSEDSFERMMQRYLPKENQPPVFPKNDKSLDAHQHAPINRRLSFEFDEAKASTLLPKGREPKSTLFMKPSAKNRPGSGTKKKHPPTCPKIKIYGNLPPCQVSENKGLKLRSFLESLSALTPIPWCDPKALDFRNNFKTKKEELSKFLYKMFNENIFDNRLPPDMLIEWNVRLNKTAGYCYNRSYRSGQTGIVTRSSRIELSTKVCNSADRLRDTLVHEMCHAVNWVASGVSNGHGTSWKSWAAKAMSCYQELPVIARCHAYKIDTKFTYKCTICGYSIDRHSKSLDINAKRCGYCRGTFELFVNKTTTPKNGGTPVARTPKAPSGFALYVKEQYSSVKKDGKNLKHGDVMKLLAQQFSANKISN